MASVLTAPATPRLPPAPEGGSWNSTQWAVLMSLLDAALAPVVPATNAAAAPSALSASAAPPADGLVFDRASVKTLAAADFDAVVASTRAAFSNPPDAALVARLLADRPSDNPLFLDALRRTLFGVAPPVRNALGGLLSSLSRRSGALLLTGSFTPFHEQPVADREAVLQRWSRSWLPSLRIAARSLEALAQTSWLMSAPLFRQVTGYSDVPPNWRAGKEYPFAFMQLGAEEKDSAASDTSETIETIETDVVIVGSGCGGAVCAQVLTAAGHSVVVVDKGYHFAPSQLPMPQNEGARLLYENGGIVAASNPSISVIAGSCWGGGGTINWSVSLRTPDRVRKEWASPASVDGCGAGLAFVDSPAYDAALDRVCAFMGVNEPLPAGAGTAADRQSHRGRVILDGAARLRFEAAPLLQNTAGGLPHDDGHCHLGCASSEKLGTAVSWLPAAADAGARFVEGFHVERVLFDGDDPAAPAAAAAPIPHTVGGKAGTPKRAIGVVGRWRSRDTDGGVAGPVAERRVVIKANKVIVSCGSLWSPVVLRNSGLQNPQIGQNLRLHPCNMVAAFFEEETKPMDNGIITSICTSFVDLDGEFHGPRLEGTCMVPYAILSNLPWTSSLDFKTAAMRYPHMDGFISLTRDRDSGRVNIDPTTGQPVVDYTLSTLDRENAVEGAIGIARLCHAQGAREIRAFIAGAQPYVRATAAAATDAAADDATFEAWVKELRRVALSTGPLWGGWSAATPIVSAHQMGTCRMADDAGAASVVDPRGQVWGTQNLYVADASVFPSASGANPMVTVMAMADCIAQGIAQERTAAKSL